MSMIIKHYGGFINHERLIDLTNTNKLGTTAFDIVNAFLKLGFNSYGIKYELTCMQNIKLPAIAHTIINNSYNHFVVIYEINFEKKYLIIADPANKIYKTSFDNFKKIFTGYIIISYPTRIIEKEKSIKLKDYITSYFSVRNVIACLLLIFSFYILSVSYLLLVKTFIQNKNITISFFIPLILLLKYLVSKIKSKYILNIKLNTYKSLMKESFYDVISLPYSYYRNHTTGEIINRLDDINNIKEAIDVLVILITDTIIILLTGLILFMINKTLFCLTLAIIILYLINYLSKYRKIKNSLYNLKQLKSNLSSYETELVVGFESIKGQNLEKSVFDRLNKKSNDYLNTLNNHQSLINMLNNKNDFISDLYIYLIILFGLVLINKNFISYSDLLVYYAISNYFLEPIFNISNIVLLLSDIKLSLNRLIDIKYKNKIHNKNTSGDINISNLDFSLRDKTILNNLNLEINKGDKIALIGSSGCGKSTLLKLLKQYYKTNNITINDENIKDLNMKDKITYISQDEYLFTDTLYNNIVLDKEINNDELNRIIDICALNDLLSKNNMNLDMLIEENGFNLSGGEIERVVLARALVHIKDYLFIDEGLSEVNVDLERNILNKILTNYKDKTIIFVTHRMNNIDLFDRIIDLDSMN